MSKSTPPSNHKSIYKRLMSGGFWVLAGRLLGAVIALLLNALLARLLTPVELGSYYLILSIVAVLAIIVQFGTHQSIVRLISGALVTDDADIRKYFKSVILLLSITATLVSLAYWSGMGDFISDKIFKSETIKVMSGVIIAFMVLRVAQTILSQTLRGFHDIKLATLIDRTLTSGILLVCVLVIWLASIDIGLYEFLYLTIIALIISVMIGGVLVYGKIKIHEPSSGMELKNVFLLSAPLFVSSFFILGINEVHIWVLGAYVGETEVAFYGAAYRLMLLIGLPLMLVNNVIPPMITQLYKKENWSALENVMRSTATVSAVPAIIIFIVILMFSELIMTQIYGDAFSQASGILVILAIGQTVNVLTGSPGLLLAMTDYQKILMKVATICGFIGILTSMLLVEKYGGIGIAYGVITGMMLQNVVLMIFCRYRMNIRTESSFKQLRQIAYRLRSEIARKSQDGGIYLQVEIFLRKLESIYFNVRGTQVVYCFGDSHTNIFHRINRSRCLSDYWFRVTAVRAATAYGLSNKNSSTLAYKKFHSVLTTEKVDAAIFLLGEVDMGYAIWAIAEKKGLEPYDVMRTAVENYTGVLGEFRVRVKKMAIISAPQPSVKDNEITSESQRMRKGLKATQKQRTELTLEYNRLLNEWADKNQVLFIGLDMELLNQETELLYDRFIKKTKVDNHYDPIVFSELLCDMFGRDKIKEWLIK